ncbi:DinB family protein [Spirosoma pollinicola]|uniref:DinB family protein n=1 Tax=Spirosoma pollinicola TaxID=2057025 RepID=A0A2K8Z9Y7_9BACT|nr:DinB family protein [Spirosoma pollinicola]AUD06693.1 DinB family protein [Spirosoma pollinicola]
MQKAVLLDMLAQNRTTCSFAFDQITVENLPLRLNDETASIGFIYRHVGEMMNLFGLFFGLPVEIQNTTMGELDKGQGQDIKPSQELIAAGYAMFEAYVETTPDEAWHDTIETPFFGTVSRARLFSHVLFHTAHHAGQLSLTLSRAKKGL